MKNRTDKILLIAFFASLIFYVFLLPNCYFTVLTQEAPRWAYLDLVYDWLSWCFHSVPAFCLQLLLCRTIRHRFAVLPSLAVVGFALWSAYGYSTSTGWDTLFYNMFLQISAAPAVGCVLAWAAYGGWSHWKGKRSE